jgi:hypothetical protein
METSNLFGDATISDIPLKTPINHYSASAKLDYTQAAVLKA